MNFESPSELPHLGTEGGVHHRSLVTFHSPTKTPIALKETFFTAPDKVEELLQRTRDTTMLAALRHEQRGIENHRRQQIDIAGERSIVRRRDRNHWLAFQCRSGYWAVLSSLELVQALLIRKGVRRGSKAMAHASWSIIL